MPERKSFVAVCIFVFVFALLGRAQDDAASLGDVARKSRQQKQQDAQPQIAQPQIEQTQTAGNKTGAPSADVGSPAASAVQNKDAGSAARASAPGNHPQGSNQDPQAPAASGTKPAKPKHVITNDEIPSRGGPTGYRQLPPQSANMPGDGNPGADPPKYTAGDWAAQIQAQKSAVANLQGQIQQTSDSIQYAGANCVSNCIEWNEQQKRKQDQVESMKTMLDEAQQKLDQMQDAARRQGYGSSVYEQ
jgi:hypothetical protein